MLNFLPECVGYHNVFNPFSAFYLFEVFGSCNDDLIALAEQKLSHTT